MHDKAGAVVIGDELLYGSRRDRHLEHVIGVLRPRGMRLAWCHVAGDEQATLTGILRWSGNEGVPVFCFGGIGATPDDRTRQAAAQAFGVGLERHPEAVRMIVERFGADATATRLRMADLPSGCTLIPNPVNNFPGFSLGRHHFLPGFPQLAWPMLEWVLDSFYSEGRTVSVERAVRVNGVAESELVGLMESLIDRHANARLFSLPQLGEHHCIELGFRGEEQAVNAALADLIAELGTRGIAFEQLPTAELRKPLT